MSEQYEHPHSDDYASKLKPLVEQLQADADDQFIEMVIDDTFGDYEPLNGISATAHNIDKNRIGVMSLDVKEFPDDDISFFIFNSKLYEYAKDEGFEKDDMYGAFPKQIMQHVTKEEFFDHLLDK